MVASTGTIASQHAGQVAGAVAQQGHGFAAQCGEHQFAYLPVGYGFQRLGIDNLHDVIVLPEMQSVLFLALKAYSRTAHLRHAEGVVCLHAEHLLDALALLLAVRFCTDGKDAQLRVLAGIDAFLVHHLLESGQVGGNGMDGRGAEVLDELDLTQ